MTPRHPHPWVFMVLIIPFGAMGGYFGVTLAYQLSHSGVSVGQVAAFVALTVLPHTFKAAWAPIADTTLSRKRWYLMASVVTSAGMALAGFLPATKPGLAALSVVAFLASLATTFLGMSVESLMAYGAPESEKGRVGGWFQAGNLGGAGVGGGAGLWMVQHLGPQWVAGVVLGIACLACAVPLIQLTEPQHVHRGGGVVRSLTGVARDLWDACRARMGWLALLLCFIPVGTGAAGGLFAAIAKEWHASADAVAIATGLLSGVASAFGCLIGGWMSDRMNRQGSYALYSLIQAACAVAMAFAPRTQAMFLVFTIAYSIIAGLTYAGFSAFVLEAIGKGAAATKYNVYASLSNFPIYYMTLFEGWAHDRWNTSAALELECGAALVGLVLFGGAALLSRPRAVPSAAEPAQIV